MKAGNININSTIVLYVFIVPNFIQFFKFLKNTIFQIKFKKMECIDDRSWRNDQSRNRESKRRY